MEKECFSILEVEQGIDCALPSPGREDMGQCNLLQMTTVASLREETQKDPDCISDTEPSAPPRPEALGKCPHLDLDSGTLPWLGASAQGHRSHHPGDAGSPAKSTWVPQHTCWAALPGEPRSTPWRGGVGPGMMAALEAAPPRYSTETPASALIRQCRQYWSSEMSSILLFSFLLLDFQYVFIINHIPPFPGGCSFPSEKATYKQTNVPPFLVEMPSTALPLTSGFCKVT